jgi:hypothetical protein
MAMNFEPLDCPCQGASSESKKIDLDFCILKKFSKKTIPSIKFAPRKNI